MRNLFDGFFKVLAVSSVAVLSWFVAAYADVAPDQPAAPSTAQTSASQDSAAPSSGTKQQFAAVETAPPASAAPTAPDYTQKTPQPNPSGINFPKVKSGQDAELARKFAWWPTDSKPAPVKDPNRSGYWWWPAQPGQQRPWGNQGYVYVRKIIFDYKAEPGEAAKPSLVIKKVLMNVKVYFDFDQAVLRDDAIDALNKALFTLEHNQKADILITGNCDVRGSEKYNEKLGERRAAAVRQYILDKGVAEERIKILSRGKLDAMAPKNDLVGMQKDRNAQFMVAEVEEIMIPASQAHLYEDKVVEEKKEVEGQIRVATKDYVIQSGDTLWGIAQREYADGKQWKRIYEFNQDVIRDPNRPKKGTKIKIPIENNAQA